MDGATLARLAAVTCLGLAAVVGMVEFNRDETDPNVGASLLRATEEGSDPLDPELTRCQHLGEAGTRDRRCLKAWAESRERFLSNGGRSTGQGVIGGAATDAANPTHPVPR